MINQYTPQEQFPQRSQLTPQITNDIVIENITILQTGTYTTPMIRPYTANLTGDTIAGIHHVLENSYMNKASPTQIAGNIGPFFGVSTQAESAVEIPNGWNENRCRFVLKARVRRNLGNDIIYYVQGYTDYLGVSLTGAVDPNMTFIINSYIAVEEIVYQTPMGPQIQERIVENNNILSDGAGNIDYTRQYYNQLRPNDIYGSIQINHLNDFNNGSVFDPRVSLVEPIRSAKSNNNPVQYFTKLVNNYIDQSRVMGDSGGSNDDYARLLDLAMDKSDSSPLYENGFFKLLAKLYNTPKPVNTFTLNVLSMYDNSLSKKINYLNASGRLAKNIYSSNQSEYWSVQTREVVAATTILNSLSAIMFDLLISKIILTSTNMDVTGRMYTAIVDSKAISSADYTANIQRLITRFETEVMFELTFKNQDSYELYVEIDLFGGSRVDIGFSGHPKVPFTYASFADSCMPPVLTKNVETRNMLVSDMETVLNMITTGNGSPMSGSSSVGF